MRTLKLTLAYDGTAFVGWQRQQSGISIQGLVEDAFARIEGSSVVVTGAGRTDAGVHAVGQVASVRVGHPIGVAPLQRALNAILPEEVRVLEVVEAPGDFHARFGARAKTYHYRIVTGYIVSPFERRYAWHVTQPLDIEAMRAAARPLVGTHDFAAFRAAGTETSTTVRTITRLDVTETAPPVAAVADPRARAIALEVDGDGFLRHMVRTIAGTLVEIGTGRRTPQSIVATLASKDRSEAGPTAPPWGLFLVRVEY